MVISALFLGMAVLIFYSVVQSEFHFNRARRGFGIFSISVVVLAEGEIERQTWTKKASPE